MKTSDEDEWRGDKWRSEWMETKLGLTFLFEECVPVRSLCQTEGRSLC